MRINKKGTVGLTLKQFVYIALTIALLVFIGYIVYNLSKGNGLFGGGLW